jgi:hypothetical protein
LSNSSDVVVPPLIKILTYGEQMVQGLPIQAKYQHQSEKP